MTAAKLNEQIRDNMNAVAPVGSLHWRMQAATTTETTIDGFVLECNAVAVSRTTYSALNTKLSGLSYPFGSGNGSTTMNLPDLQGRTPVSMSSGGNSAVDAVGDSDGVAKASRTPKGTVSGTTGSEASHTHGAGTYVTGGSGNQGAIGSGGGWFMNAGQGTVVGTSGAGSSHSHSFSGTVPGNFLVVGVIGVKY